MLRASALKTFLLTTVLAYSTSSLFASGDEIEFDCNNNGIPDAEELRVLKEEVDCDGNNIIDSCELIPTLIIAEEADIIITGDGARSLEVADIDNDGDSDYILINTFDHTASIIVNSGGGIFSHVGGIDLEHRTFDITIADFDNDGFVDLAAVNVGYDGIDEGNVPMHLRIYKNIEGTFHPTPVRMSLEAEPFSFWAITHLDVNKDGKQDLALSNREARELWVYENEGDFQFKRKSKLPIGRSPLWITPGDFDSNGLVDIAVISTSEDNISILRNLDPETFEAASSETIPSGADEIYSLKLADFDGDGDQDFYTSGHSHGDVPIFINDGEGKFTHTTSIQFEFEIFDAQALDFNDDGILDMVVSNEYEDTIEIRLGLGDLNFSHAIFIPVGDGPGPVNVIDANNDGIDDIAAGFGGKWNSNLRRAQNGGVASVISQGRLPNEKDIDNNLMLDVCQKPTFHRGDVNTDLILNIADPIHGLRYMFSENITLSCFEAADVDNSDQVNLTDPILLLQYLFIGGIPPHAPGPPTGPCGVDPDPIDTDGNLGCENYPPCG